MISVTDAYPIQYGDSLLSTYLQGVMNFYLLFSVQFGPLPNLSTPQYHSCRTSSMLLLPEMGREELNYGLTKGHLNGYFNTKM